MGKRHALHFYQYTPRANVLAVSSPDADERKWAVENLEGVKVYSDYEEMLSHEGLQAVVIASVTSVHAEQAIKAIQKGLHVLSEKPLSTNVEISQSVVDARNAVAKKYPDQKVMCGFSRRFDASYRDAFAKMSSGAYGEPAVFHSRTCDMYDKSGFFVAYAQFSGGIFVDCSIHDIDLALWFFGEDSKVKSVQAVGITAVHPELRQHNDRDNAVATIEFYGEKVASLYCCRMMAAGQEDFTEVICKKGTLAVNMQGRKNHTEIHDSYGIRREIPQTYYDRFKDAFLTEANEFTACCLDNTEEPVKLEGAVKAVRIGAALQESLITGNKIFFDENGNRIDRAKL
ncbi:putative nad-binding rossmann fold oxidoreductase family protein [Phaeomoniella chlamydospora]|uniref:Putative nad-binding rossmann fold oxidoreductase family protein n=1 Tax=Phaeomoniella chlamydospora TaxID=158046 RepID=A0A0G2DU84_PHACM|nr:putative nad-binding rossmann fold oxidoreductase family protein [Phaeomoniella chlamydospora]